MSESTTEQTNEQTVTVKPREGYIVRKEDFAFLRPEGETVPLTKYVRRRIAQGDMMVVAEVKSSKKGKPT